MRENLLTPHETQYLERVCRDLMSITGTLIRAKQALEKLPLDPAMSIVSVKHGGDAYDAVITAYTLAELILRDFPLSLLGEIRR